MPAHAPRQIVHKAPPILSKCDNLAALEVAAQGHGEATPILIINKDVWHRVLGSVSFNLRVIKSIMGDADLIQNTGDEHVSLSNRKVMRVQGVRERDWSVCGERTAPELINASKSGNVCDETQTIL